MAQLLAKAEFLEKRQSAKIHEEKLKIEEEYVKSKARVKILEAIESEDHRWEFNVDDRYKGEINKATDEKPKIQHQETKQYHYDHTTVGDRKFDFKLIKQPLHEKTVKGSPANAKSWAPSKPTGGRYKKVNVLDSKEIAGSTRGRYHHELSPFHGPVQGNC